MKTMWNLNNKTSYRVKKRVIIWFILAFVLITIQEGFFSKKAPFSTWESNSQVKPSDISASSSAMVTRVVDGDTIVVLTNGVTEKVRLIGVDTPETIDPRRPVQCFGKEASAFTKSLLENKDVHIEADSSQDNRDKYGRLLRYVFLSDGTLLNQEIIAEGYGHEYTYHTPHKYQNEFRTAERSARESKKGLWRQGVCGA